MFSYGTGAAAAAKELRMKSMYTKKLLVQLAGGCVEAFVQALQLLECQAYPTAQGHLMLCGLMWHVVVNRSGGSRINRLHTEQLCLHNRP
jgi:hypothetical protein